MLIVCPQCTSRYEIGDDTVPENGRVVRCARCRTEWNILPKSAAELDAEDWALATMAFEPTAADAAMEAALALHAEPDPPLQRVPAAPPHGPAMSVEEAAARDAEPPLRKKTMRKASQRPSRFSGRTGLLIAGALASLVVLVGFRQAIVRAVPATAGLYAAIGLPVNLRGLAFEDVHTSHGSEGGAPVLVVEGTIRNITRGPLALPRLKLAIRDKDGTEIYGWTTLPAKSSLEAGDTLAFRSRLASPPEGSDVAVRFARREDLLLKPKATGQPPPAAPEAVPAAPKSPDVAPAEPDGHSG